MTHWTPGRVLAELADPKTRLDICRAFFEQAPKETKAEVYAVIAKLRSFRPVFLQRQSKDELAGILASLHTSPQVEPYLSLALSCFHLAQRRPLLGAFLDACGVPHKDGGVDGDAMPKIPTEAVVAAAKKLEKDFPSKDILLYVASACVCNPDWYESFGAAADALASHK